MLKALLVMLLVVALPVAVFMVLYSLDYGCFLCLSGDLEGSQTEKWLNLGFAGALFAFVLALMGAWVWDRVRPK